MSCPRHCDDTSYRTHQANRGATIRNAITNDRKSVDDLKKAGYTEQEIKDAFFGRRQVIPGFKDEIPADWKSPAGLATIERDDKGFRLVFAKKEKTEAERRAEEEARKAAKEYFRDYIKEMEEADNRRRELEGKQFQERLANNARIAEANLAHIETVYSFEERRAGFVRGAQLPALDASDAQTIDQKVAVEQRKAAIEVEHITRVHEIRMRLFDLETSRMVLEEEATLKRLGYRVDESVTHGCLDRTGGGGMKRSLWLLLIGWAAEG